jgi:hypothetical protein
MSMTGFGFRRVILLSVILVVICATATVAGWSLNLHLAQSPQGRGKVIGKMFTRNSVVEFEQIKVSGKPVKFDEAFDGSDEWLPTVLLSVKNISNKSIVYLSVDVNFPETRSLRAMMSYPIELGQKPESKFPTRNAPMVLLPGDTLEIQLQDHYPKIKTFVEKQWTIKDIRKAELEIGFVIFDDRTAWAAGNFYRQDPTNPGHYINIGDKPAQ